MVSASDEFDTDPVGGWTREEETADTLSWLGSDERIVCAREGDEDEWTVYSQPRSELAVPNRVALIDEPTELETALATVRQYMESNPEGE